LNNHVCFDDVFVAGNQFEKRLQARFRSRKHLHEIPSDLQSKHRASLDFFHCINEARQPQVQPRPHTVVNQLPKVRYCCGFLSFYHSDAGREYDEKDGSGRDKGCDVSMIFKPASGATNERHARRRSAIRLSRH
jgi:hypothetical protein